MATTETKEAKAARFAQAKLDAAQDDCLPGAPNDAHIFDRGEWNALPHRKLMERIAFHNLANWTGELDWLHGSTALNGNLEAVGKSFCDNLVLKCLVPPEVPSWKSASRCLGCETKQTWRRCTFLSARNFGLRYAALAPCPGI